MVASHLSSTGWHRGGPVAGRVRLATTEPTLLSSCMPLCLLIFHFAGFGLQQPCNLKLPLCWLQQHRVGLQPSATGWRVAAGLLCANPPHDNQQSNLVTMVFARLAWGHYIQISAMLSLRLHWFGFLAYILKFTFKYCKIWVKICRPRRNMLQSLQQVLNQGAFHMHLKEIISIKLPDHHDSHC